MPNCSECTYLKVQIQIYMEDIGVKKNQKEYMPIKMNVIDFVELTIDLVVQLKAMNSVLKINHQVQLAI